MSSESRSAVCSIVPPYILRKLLESNDNEVREAALRTMLTTTRLRGERAVRSLMGAAAATQGEGRRSIFDCRGEQFLGNAVLVQSEQGPVSPTIPVSSSARQAFEGFGLTRQFYKDVLQRNSIDDLGMRLNGYVHYDHRYNNAFWDGNQMVFGDGDGVRFTDFTKSIDVIAHELTHGVTEKTSGLIYHHQSGAINESISDVFGTLVKQWSLNQTADEGDWLIGMEVFTPSIGADALRSMKAPGTAYNNSLYGKDPQPDHFSKYVKLPDNEDNDYGGVHLYSGIPNKAFYLTAVAIGGYAWEAPGHIWYESLKASTSTSDFQDFADTTYFKAGQLFGSGSQEQQAVQAAWKEVGIRISGVPGAGSRGRRDSGGASPDSDTMTELARQIESLASQVKSLTRDVKSLKDRR